MGNRRDTGNEEHAPGAQPVAAPAGRARSRRPRARSGPGGMVGPGDRLASRDMLQFDVECEPAMTVEVAVVLARVVRSLQALDQKGSPA